MNNVGTLFMVHQYVSGGKISKLIETKELPTAFYHMYESREMLGKMSSPVNVQKNYFRFSGQS